MQVREIKNKEYAGVVRERSAGNREEGRMKKEVWDDIKELKEEVRVIRRCLEEVVRILRGKYADGKGKGDYKGRMEESMSRGETNEMGQKKKEEEGREEGRKGSKGETGGREDAEEEETEDKESKGWSEEEGKKGREKKRKEKMGEEKGETKEIERAWKAGEEKEKKRKGGRSWEKGTDETGRSTGWGRKGTICGGEEGEENLWKEGKGKKTGEGKEKRERRGSGLREEVGKKRKEEKGQKRKEAEEGRAAEKVKGVDFGGRRWENRIWEKMKERQSERRREEEERWQKRGGKDDKEVWGWSDDADSIDGEEEEEGIQGEEGKEKEKDGELWWRIIEEWKEEQKRKDKGRRKLEERAWKRIEERAERVRREREREEGDRLRKEEEERRRRERNVVWKGVEGKDQEERKAFVEGIMKIATSRVVVIKKVEERIEAGRWILITELEDEGDKKEVLENGEEIEWKWGVEVDEDLTMGERKMRWRILEATKRKRAKGRRVVVMDRELWVDGYW